MPHKQNDIPLNELPAHFNNNDNLSN